jgi:hypothetical protein
MHFMISKAGVGLMTAGMVLALSGCGDKKDSTNMSEVQMKDLDAADGTINDAMTDLDGVQTEGTALVEASNASSNASGAKAPASAGNDSEPAKEGDSEVVADQ